MPETKQNLHSAFPDAALDQIAALLAEQILACHDATARCFKLARDSDSLESLKIATRLIQASATAAAAIKRIKGSEFHQHVTISRGGDAQ